MKTRTTKLPKLLVVRPFRETCLAFYAKSKKFDVTYLTVGKQDVGRLPPNFSLVKTQYFPNVGKINNLSWAGMCGVRKFVKEADIICLTDTYYIYNLQLLFWAVIYHKTVVTVVWATIANHISSWLFPYSLVTYFVRAKSKHFILRNFSALQFTDSLSIARDKITVSYKGVDLSHFYPRKLAKQSKVLNILYLARLEESKGIKELVGVFEKLIKEGFSLRLIVGGNGTLESYVKQKII